MQRAGVAELQGDVELHCARASGANGSPNRRLTRVAGWDRGECCELRYIESHAAMKNTQADASDQCCEAANFRAKLAHLFLGSATNFGPLTHRPEKNHPSLCELSSRSFLRKRAEIAS